jgi:archaellum component FlaG (FlaF/FlaG flagellin family)
MTRRTRHWIAAASVAAAAAAGGFTVTAAMNTPSPADATVITVHGDTVKNPTAKNGWGDGTPANTNIVLTGITASGVD